MNCPNPDLLAVVGTFLQQYAQDRVGGHCLPLERYQSRFPGFEDAIAREYRALQADGDGVEAGNRRPARRMADLRRDAPAASDGGSGAPPDTPRYRVLEEIGRGGMGRVYRVWDRDLRRVLAMKVLSGESAGASSRPSDPNALTRFLQEVHVTGRLEHPGIVPVHELGIDPDGHVYFTMPLIRGDDFGVIIERVHDDRDDWNLPRALGVVLRVCEAVASAHEKGIVHRDLKPANVMVGPFGEAYVVDWGLARVEGGSGDAPYDDLERFDGADGPPMTVAGDVFGTPAYMPPEQARGDDDHVGAAIDIYAIGAILYHLLTGSAPYRCESGTDSSRAVLARVLAGPPAEISLLAPSMPSELAAICDKAMARDPERRYLHARDLAKDLRAFLEQRVVGAYEAGAWAELRKWILRNRGLAAASVFAILALLIGTGVSLLLMARSEQHNVRATEALRTGRVAQGRLTGRSGDLRVAERLLWSEYLTSRSSDSFWALQELYQGHPCLASRSFGAAVNDVAWGPDDAWAVTASEDGALRVLDPKTLHQLAELRRPSGAALLGLDISPYGLVATGGGDGCVVLWDIGRREVVRVIEDAADGDEDDVVSDVRFSPDGSMLASVEMDGDVHLWDPQSGVQLRSFVGQRRLRIADVCFSPDGARLASHGNDGRIRIWTIANGACAILEDAEQLERGEFDRRDLVTCTLAFTSGGKRLVSGGTDSVLRVFDVDQLSSIGTVPLLGSTIRKIAVNEAEGTIALATAVRVEVRDIDTLGRRRQVMTDASNAAAFSTAGTHLITGDSTGVVHVWEVGDASALHLGGHEGRVESVTSSDGCLLATGDGAGRVRVFELPAGRMLFELGIAQTDGTTRAHRSTVRALSFRRDGRLLASGAMDRTVRVWELDTRSCLRTIPDHHCVSGNSVQFGADDRLLVSRPGGTVAVIDTRTGDEIRTLRSTGHEVIGAVWQPAGGLIASTSRDKVVRLWGPRGASYVLDDPSLANWSLAFSGDGAYVASGGWQGQIELYGVERRVPIAIVRGRAGLVADLAFLPGSSRWLASAHSDGTVRLWDWDEQRCVLALDGFAGRALSVSWGRDGKTLIASGEDANVIVWDLEHFERRVAGNLHRHVELLRPDLGDAIDERALYEWADRLLSR